MKQQFLAQHFRKIFLFSVILICGLILPFYFSFAWSTGLKVVSNFPLALVALIASILISVPSIVTIPFVGLAGELLKWAAQGKILAVRLTDPSQNEMVKIGLDVTMPLANMAILLGFVTIAIATILGMENYGLEKILPTLIIIALLINFAPLLVGIVVDFSNVIMSYFANAFDFGRLTALTMGKLGNVWSDLLSPIKNKWIYENINPNTEGGFVQALIKALALGASQIAFNILGALTMLLVFALLVTRTIMIMILTILAPLAFVAYAIPATKKYFTQWWNHLLQWSFVGVIATFFLYLSSQMLEITTGGTFISPAPQGSQDWMNAMISPLIQGTFPLVILVIGFFASMKGGAMFAGTAIAGATLLGKKIGSWGVTKGKGYLGGAVGAMNKDEEGKRKGWQGFKGGYLQQTGKDFGRRSAAFTDSLKGIGMNFKKDDEGKIEKSFRNIAWGSTKTLGKGLLGYTGLPMGKKALSWGKQKLSPEVRIMLTKKQNEENKKQEERANVLQNDPAALESMTNSNNVFERNAAARTLASEGHLEKPAFKDKKDSILTKAIKEGEHINPEATKEILKYYPTFAGLIGKEVGEAVAKANPAKMGTSEFEKGAFLDEMRQNWGHEKFNALATRNDFESTIAPKLKDYLGQQQNWDKLSDSAKAYFQSDTGRARYGDVAPPGSTKTNSTAPTKKLYTPGDEGITTDQAIKDARKNNPPQSS